MTKGVKINTTNLKCKHYQSEIIKLCCHWYLKYPLSYRNLEEMMLERNIEVDHTTIMRRVKQYVLEKLTRELENT